MQTLSTVNLFHRNPEEKGGKLLLLSLSPSSLPALTCFTSFAERSVTELHFQVKELNEREV